MSVREVAEGLQIQGEDEEIAWAITTTNWGSSPSEVSVVTKDVTAGGTDVTDEVMSGDASVSGDVITLPVLSGLTAGHLYRVEVQFTASSNVFEAYLMVQAET